MRSFLGTGDDVGVLGRGGTLAGKYMRGAGHSEAARGWIGGLLL
jgi:hypothetical protein